MRTLKALIPSVLVLTASAALAAADPQWGVQGAVALPFGGLSDSARPGLQGGGHVRWDFGNGHGLMARADLTWFGQRHGDSASSLGVAADYTYHLDRNRRGLYFLGGLSVVNYQYYQEDGRSRHDSNLGLDLGLGFDLSRNLGLLGRYTTHDGSGRSLDCLTLGMTYRF